MCPERGQGGLPLEPLPLPWRPATWALRPGPPSSWIQGAFVHLISPHCPWPWRVVAGVPLMRVFLKTLAKGMSSDSSQETWLGGGRVSAHDKFTPAFLSLGVFGFFPFLDIKEFMTSQLCSMLATNESRILSTNWTNNSVYSQLLRASNRIWSLC